MTTTTANKFTDEDSQLSEVNQLGTLLDVYRLKLRYIRFYRRINLLSCIVGIVGLALVIGLGFKNWHQLQTGNYFDFFPPLLVSLMALFRGEVLWRIEVQRAQTARVIICEHGLLKVNMSLARGKENYLKFGAMQKRTLAFVRPPLPEEL